MGIIMLFLIQACGNSENIENQGINETISEDSLEINTEKPNNPPPGENNPPPDDKNSPPDDKNPPPGEITRLHLQEKRILTELYKFLRMQMMIF